MGKPADGNGLSVQAGDKRVLKSVDPVGIYSGMNKRVALSDGEWYPEQAEESIGRGSKRAPRDD